MAVIVERVVNMAIFSFSNVKHLLLEMAQHQTVDVVLKLAVNALDTSSGVGLVRIWLIEPADLGRLWLDKRIAGPARPAVGRFPPLHGRQLRGQFRPL